MHHVRLYTTSKTAMQSGKNSTKKWILETINPEAKFHDPVMGWAGTADTHHQVMLHFDTLDDALHYCKKYRLVPTLIEGGPQHSNAKSYTDNFTKGFR
ncbi:MAG: ETC complex I subunit, partial [Alphaproteobacteria bacterium]|nr:ETC complex I subunit [Alphaproteobacteria bacterium]MBX9977854.1 ETC complex I subunit [Alphaproteobacteria bacterium]